MSKVHMSMLKIYHFINFIVKYTTSEIQGFEVLNILVYFQDLPQWGSLGWDNYKGHQCSSPHDIHLAPCKRIKAGLYRIMRFFSRR